jgi:hypothetical protein
VNIMLSSDLFQFFDCRESLLFIAGGQVDFCVMFKKGLVIRFRRQGGVYFAGFPTNSSVASCYADDFSCEIGHVFSCPFRLSRKDFLEECPKCLHDDSLSNE